MTNAPIPPTATADVAETTLTSNLLYAGKIIHVFADNVALPNGQTAMREVVRHPGAVAVLATTDDDHIVLIRQFRYATAQVLWEIPAGKIDPEDTSLQQAAARELAEETPYTARHWQRLYAFYTSAGFCDEKITLFHATGLCANSQLRPDADEMIHTVLLSRQDCQKLLSRGEIADAKTLIALQYWLAH